MRNLKQLKNITLLILCILVASKINAQVAPNIWLEHDYDNTNTGGTGLSGRDGANDVVALSTGIFAVAGYSSDGTNPNNIYPTLRGVYPDNPTYNMWITTLCTGGYGYFSELIRDSENNIVAIGQRKPCAGGTTDECILAKFNESGTLLSSNTISLTGSSENQGVSICQANPGTNPPQYAICGATKVSGVWKGFIAIANASLVKTSESIFSQAGASRATHIVFCSSVPSVGSVNGFAVSGYISNTDDDAYVARYNTSLTLLWDVVINSQSLPPTMSTYTKKESYTGPCTQVVNYQDRAEHVDFNPSSTGFLPNLGHIVLGTLFNTNITTCSGAPYKDADGVIIMLNDAGTVAGPSYNRIEGSNNIAHLSGQDWIFKTKFDFDGNVASIGSTSDYYWTNTYEQRIYFQKSNINNVLWRKFIRSAQNGNLNARGLLRTFNADYVICGYNNSNNENAVTLRLTCDCSGSPINNTYFYSDYTVPNNTVVDGIYTVKPGVKLTIAGTVKFKQPCGKILLAGNNGTGAKLYTNANSTLKPVDGYENHFEGIVSYSNSLISLSATTTIERADRAINSMLLNNFGTLIDASLGSVFLNCENVLTYNGNSALPLSSQFSYNNFQTTTGYPTYFSRKPILFNTLYADPLKVDHCNFTNTNPMIEVYGISKGGGLQLQALNNTFDKISRGILTSGSTVSYDKVNSNTFTNIPQPPVTSIGGGGLLIGQNYAISTVGSQATHIEGNTITGTGAFSMKPIFGIISDNTGTGNLLFKNTMSNTYIGLQAQIANSNLVVSCNNFNGYSYSFINAKYSWNVASGPMREQGGVVPCTNGGPAGNQWNAGCTGSNVVDIKVVAASYFNYWSYGTTVSSQPQCSTTGWEPTYMTPKICLGLAMNGTSCNNPFATCTGCHLTQPQSTNPLVNSMSYYTALSDAAEQNWLNSNQTDLQAHSELANAQGYMKQVENELVGDLISQQKYTEAMDVLQNSNFPSSHRQLMQLQYHLGYYQKVRDNFTGTAHSHRSLVNQYYQDSLAQAAEAADASAFADYMGVLINAAEVGRAANQLLPNEIDIMQNIVSTNTPTGVAAENIITLNTGEVFEHGVLMPNDTEEVVAYKTSDIENVTEDHPVNLYPVPSSKLVNFDLLVSAEDAVLKITDINGSYVQSIRLNAGINHIEYPVNDLPQGVYIYLLKQADGKVATGKFVVNH